MKVEIDVSDLEYGAYYKDEKCKELEAALQSDSRYAECEVKRAHSYHDGYHDPFCVLDQKGKEILMFERWEAYAFSGSELISYVDVDRARLQASHRETSFMIPFVVVIAFALASSIASGVFFYSGDYESLSISMTMTLLTGILSLFTSIVYYSVHRSTILHIKNIDLETVRRDHSFLDMLLKLIEAAEDDEYTRKELVKRVRLIEDSLAGISP